MFVSYFVSALLPQPAKVCIQAIIWLPRPQMARDRCNTLSFIAETGQGCLQTATRRFLQVRLLMCRDEIRQSSMQLCNVLICSNLDNSPLEGPLKGNNLVLHIPSVQMVIEVSNVVL